MIQGSANINQRSMDGGRDTELAIGAYQPAHVGEGNEKHARGQAWPFSPEIIEFTSYNAFKEAVPYVCRIDGIDMV